MPGIYFPVVRGQKESKDIIKCNEQLSIFYFLYKIHDIIEFSLDVKTMIWILTV